MRAPFLWLAGTTALMAALGTFATASSRSHPLLRVQPFDTTIASRSIDFFEKRLAVDPHNFMVAGRLVNRYVLRFGTGANMADVQRAEEIARELVRTAPDRGQALSRLSGVVLMQHKFHEALDAATEAARLTHIDQDAIGALFDAALASGRYAVAESALARLRPGTLGARVRRGQWLDAQGRIEPAQEAFDQICRTLERSSARPAVVAWCLTQLASIEHARSGPEAAAAVYRRALQLQPGYRGAVEGLANLALARGRWREAMNLYARIASDAHPDLYLRLAETAGFVGDPGLQREYERRFLTVAQAPGNEPLFGEVLALYFAEKHEAVARDSALALAQRDVGRRPTIESYDVLSWVRFRRGEFAEALAASDRARRWGSPSATMDYHRARILASMGRTDEAAVLWRRALERPTLLAPHARLDRARGLGSGEITTEGT